MITGYIVVVGTISILSTFLVMKLMSNKLLQYFILIEIFRLQLEVHKILKEHYCPKCALSTANLSSA